MNRRSFLVKAQILGGGLVLGWPADLLGVSERIPSQSFVPNGFLQITTDNEVIIYAKNPEIGQGVKTALPMIVAEELEVSWEDVTVRQADYNRMLGSQFAGGSTAIKTNFEALRQAGASARMMLLQAAALLWNCDVEECEAVEGTVRNKASGAVRQYGELVQRASSLDVPEEVTLKSPRDFKIIGSAQRTVDCKEIVTGKATYGIDNRQAGMLRAALIKCPVFGGTIESFSGEKAKEISGVIDVVVIPPMENPTRRMASIAVVAIDTWTAIKASKLVEIQWDFDASHLSESVDTIRSRMQTQLGGEDLTTLRSDGDVSEAFSDRYQVIEAEYEVPFLCHVAMEPMNYIADVRADRVECWGPTQVPGAVVHYANLITGIPREQIEVHQTRVGGGFGRRLLADYATEAIFLSQHLKQPVQIIWSREEDLQHDYYRPMGLYKLRGSIDHRGDIHGWEIKAATTSRYLFRSDDSPPHTTELFPDSFPAGFIANFSMQYAPITTHVPTGAWRGPGHNAICFVDQSFLDELAVVAGSDPIDHRLRILGETDREMPYDDHGGPTYLTARLKNVIRRVVDLCDWHQGTPEGKYRGFAAHFMFGAYVAEVVEISMREDRDIHIENVYVSVDCGMVINRMGAEAQIEGGIIDGLGATIYGGMSIEQGAAAFSNFHQYQMIRMSSVPRVVIDLVDSNASPEGLGEISLPPVGAALCNAIYRATGQRIRKLPIVGYNRDPMRPGIS